MAFFLKCNAIDSSIQTMPYLYTCRQEALQSSYVLLDLVPRKHCGFSSNAPKRNVTSSIRAQAEVHDLTSVARPREVQLIFHYPREALIPFV